MIISILRLRNRVKPYPPGVIVADARVVVVVAVDIARILDVEVATVLTSPVATHEQIAETTCLALLRRPRWFVKKGARI